MTQRTLLKSVNSTAQENNNGTMELGIDQTTASRYIDSKGNFREYYHEQHKERGLD
jgi:hypothetical protein